MFWTWSSCAEPKQDQSPVIIPIGSAVRCAGPAQRIVSVPPDVRCRGKNTAHYPRLANRRVLLFRSRVKCRRARKKVHEKKYIHVTQSDHRPAQSPRHSVRPSASTKSTSLSQTIGQHKVQRCYNYHNTRCTTQATRELMPFCCTPQQLRAG